MAMHVRPLVVLAAFLALAKPLSADAAVAAAAFVATPSGCTRRRRTWLHAAAKSKKKGGGGGGGMGFGASQGGKKSSAAAPKVVGGARTTTTTAAAASLARQQQQQQQQRQQELLEELQKSALESPVGKAVASSPDYGTPQMDPFWNLVPSLIQSKFPRAAPEELQRLAGFVRHAVLFAYPHLQLALLQEQDEDLIQNPWRPHEDLHAYMPNLGETQPFYHAHQLEFCRALEGNFKVIEQEYQALVQDMQQTAKDRFQSVTSMNYQSGWKTLVLFYNGHRIPDFPYHLCPVTTQLLESVPLGGRIAGFNRQEPCTGIPLHSDGNNMWLTCQMGIQIPQGKAAHIRVGPETRHWEEGKCLLYDTTYEHETMNSHPTQERVVLHVDFFNTLAMTSLEIEAMRYIYAMREEFMKAEGVAKVGAQIL